MWSIIISGKKKASIYRYKDIEIYALFRMISRNCSITGYIKLSAGVVSVRFLIETEG